MVKSQLLAEVQHEPGPGTIQHPGRRRELSFFILANDFQTAGHNDINTYTHTHTEQTAH